MTTTFTISGMNCGGCVKKVQSALENVPGVTSLHVKVGEAVVGGAVDPAKVIAIIEEKGFKVVSAG